MSESRHQGRNFDLLKNDGSPTELNAGYETRDVSATSLLRMTFAFIAILCGIVGLLRQLQLTWLERAAPSQIQSRTEQVDMIPGGKPRLQPEPRHDFQRYLAAQQRQLNSYQVIDEKKQIVQIPIDRAMKIISERSTASHGDKPVKSRKTQP